MADNQLFYGDNLDVLARHVSDEVVDLVYLDPPFKSDVNYNLLFEDRSGERSQAQIRVFEDTWHWSEEAAWAYQETVEMGGEPARAMRAFRELLGESDMLAYLAMMAPRLIELRRVMKETATLWLHCDPTASHYLKLLLDSIFGPTCFRNEVIWKRSPFAGSSKARAHQFPKNHDVLLFYSKNPEHYTFKHVYRPYEDEYYQRFKNPDNDPRGPYQSVLLKTFSQETYERLKAEDRLIEPKKPGSQPRYKQFLYELKGRQSDDVWDDVNAINPMAKERLGYPTQKPEALLERIILASSNEGDLVLDPFCGCGTTVATAHQLRRRWIGIDLTALAVSLMKHRLIDSFGPDIENEFTVVGEPTTVQDASSLAQEDPWQFELWALGLVGARPAQKSRGADKGIDGRLYFHDEGPGGKTKQVILSIKAGHTGRAHVHELRGVIERENAELGALISFQEPTRPMREEAAAAGFYDSAWGRHPRLQLLTVADLLHGDRLDMPPPGTHRTFARASARSTQRGATDQPGLWDR